MVPHHYQINKFSFHAAPRLATSFLPPCFLCECRPFTKSVPLTHALVTRLARPRLSDLVAVLSLCRGTIRLDSRHRQMLSCLSARRHPGHQADWSAPPLPPPHRPGTDADIAQRLAGGYRRCRAWAEPLICLSTPQSARPFPAHQRVCSALIADRPGRRGE